jgi:hypothetical protein
VASVLVSLQGDRLTLDQGDVIGVKWNLLAVIFTT